MDGLTSPMLIAALVTCGLSGWTSSQTAAYFSRFPNDPLILKLVVGACAFLDFAYTWFMAWIPYDWLVLHYGEPEYIIGGFVTYNVQDILTGLVTAMVQAFFAWRIYILSNRNKVIPAIICCLGCLSCAMSMATADQGWKLKTVDRFPEFNWGITLWLVSAVAADLLITGSMFYWLKTDTGHEQTTYIVKRILIQSLETNLVTGAVAALDAGLFLGIPTAGWHFIPNSMLIKLYVLTLLVNLNGRVAISNELRKIREATYGGALSTINKKSQTGTQIKVDIETRAEYSRNDDDKGAIRPNHVF